LAAPTAGLLDTGVLIVAGHVEGRRIALGELGEASPDAEPDDADEHGEIV
jgi:hypothetical protein